MLDLEQSIRNVELKTGLLEKDVSLVNTICERLAESVEKIQDMNQNVISLISLHGQRHDQHEKVETELKEDIKELHSRITTVNREIHERIDQVEHHISSRIDALRSDLANHKKQDTDKKDGGLREKIADIEKWRWTMMGAVAVIAWLVGHSDIIGKLLK